MKAKVNKERKGKKVTIKLGYDAEPCELIIGKSFVGFKCDIEQGSLVCDIRGNEILVNVTEGDYARGSYWAHAERCWSE